MKCKIVFNDGYWIIGRRVNLWERIRIPETPGTHHWIVESSSYEMNETCEGSFIKGKRVAIPIVSMKYLVIL